MKKFLFILVALFATIGLNAQPLEQSKFYDNLSLTIKGGATTPLNDPADQFKGMFGVEFEKDITPIFGLGVEGEWTINTSRWPNQLYSGTGIDHQYIGMFGTTNLMNLFAGYNGKPRSFEIETVLGIGWGHAYNNEYPDANVILTKTGLNINWNFGKQREWTLGVKPAVVWNMSKIPCMDDLTFANYNINRAALQLQVGMTYHFGNSNGTHYFTLCDKVATQSEVDSMNDKINELRKQSQEDHNYYHEQIRLLNETNQRLSKALQECNNQQPKTVEVVKLPPVQFMFNSAKIHETSQSTLKSMADMILHQEGSYGVIGYASEEGDEEYNKALSLKRAEAVKNQLVKYGVPEDRLVVEGRGATNEFSVEVPFLNRVVIVKK